MQDVLTLHSELLNMRQKADLQVSSHSYLRDHYQAWGQRLNIYILLCSALLLFFTLASEDFIQRTLGMPADAFKWSEGGVAFLTFCLSLIDLTWNPGTKSKAHDQAVAHYLRMDYAVRALLSGGQVNRDKVRNIQEEFLDAADLPRIPEVQAIPLKQRYFLKLALAKELEKDPHQPLWWLRTKLWWRSAPPETAAAPASKAKRPK